MRTQISAVALATALLATNPAIAQLSLGGGSSGLGVSLGGDEGLNVDIGVDLGGDNGVSVDAGADLGGSEGISVDAGANLGGDDGLSVDVDAGVGETIEADVDLGAGAGSAPPTSTGPNGGRLIDIIDIDVGDRPGQQTTAERPLATASISALAQEARLDVLLGQIGSPQLAGADLDAIIDDRQVGIVPVRTLLDAAAIDRLAVALQLNVDGRGELLDAIGQSNVLSSILGNQGIEPLDVLSISVDDDGSAEIIVLDGALNVAEIGNYPGILGDLGLDDLTRTELAQLDIDLLTDEELGRIDVALLPNEEQRLDAVVRLLGNQTPTQPDNQPGTSDTITVVDLDALLGNQSLAEVAATLGLGQTDDSSVTLDVDLLDALEQANIPVAAVAAIRVGGNGENIVFVDGDLIGDVATIDIGIAAGLPRAGGGAEPGTGGPGTGTGTGGEPGTGTGGTGTGGVSGPDTGSGGAGSGSGTGGTGTGAGTGTTSPGVPSGTPPNTVANGPGIGPSAPVRATVRGADGLFAEVECTIGIGALASGTEVSPSTIVSARSLELVRVVGCQQTLYSQGIDRLRGAISGNRPLAETLDNAGVPVDAVIGATLSDEVITLYVEDPTDQSVASAS